MNTYLRIPLHFDPEQLEADTARSLSAEWTIHFNAMDFEGEWTVLSLRSASGSVNDISSHPGVVFRDTPLMAACTYFKSVINSLLCEKEAVRILRLGPGSRILPHRDRGTCYAQGVFRLHIPLRTGPGVSFIVDGHELAMQPGECWYADFDKTHSVDNEGAEDRIHLVVDCVRNEWSDVLFAEAGYDFTEENKGPDKETLSRMIEELSHMNTETAQELIENLRKKLHA